MELAYRIYHPNHTFSQTGPLSGTVEKDWSCVFIKSSQVGGWYEQISKLTPRETMGLHLLQTGLHRQDEVPSRS